MSGRARATSLGRLRFGGAILKHPLQVSDRKLLGYDQLSEPLLLENVWNAGKNLGVAGREFSVSHKLLNRLGQVKQPKEIGDAAAILSQPTRQLGLGEPQLVDQDPVAFRAINRVEIFALNILDKGHLSLRE